MFDDHPSPTQTLTSELTTEGDKTTLPQTLTSELTMGGDKTVLRSLVVETDGWLGSAHPAPEEDRGVRSV